MKKSNIKTVIHTGSSKWKDKDLEKYMIVFDNDENGTYTIGFNDSDSVPQVGDELEYEIVDKGYGNEIKTQKKSSLGGFGGGGKKWSTEQIAQQDAVKVTQSYIQAGHPLKDWQMFFTLAKGFFVEEINAEGKEEEKKPEGDDSTLPF